MRMSKRFRKRVIEDIQATNIAGQEQDQLVDIFSRVMGELGVTLARKAWFDLVDFAVARKLGLDGYSLELSKQTMEGREFWVGIFESGNKRLEVMGSLEK